MKFEDGITPAYAGRTLCTTLFHSAHQDHPRLRGKDIILAQISKENLGSPPLTREGLIEANLVITCKGITPACAGKTLYPWRQGHGRRDHPRLRGKD